MTTALERGEGSASRPGRSLHPGKTRYPLYRKLDGPQGRCEQVRKISSPPGFDPRTVQRVASRYTDYVTRPTQKRRLLRITAIPYIDSSRQIDIFTHFQALKSVGAQKHLRLTLVRLTPDITFALSLKQFGSLSAETC